MPGGKSFLEVEAREGLLEEELEEIPAWGDSGPSCWIILQTEEFSFFPLVLCFFFKSMCLRPASSLWAHAVHSPAVSLGKALPIALCRKEIVIFLSSCSSSKHSSSWFSTRTSGSATKNLWDSGPPGEQFLKAFTAATRCWSAMANTFTLRLKKAWTYTCWFSEWVQRSNRHSPTASSNQPSAPLSNFRKTNWTKKTFKKNIYLFIKKNQSTGWLPHHPPLATFKKIDPYSKNKERIYFFLIKGSIFLRVYGSIRVCLSIDRSIYRSFYPPIHIYISLSLSLSFCLSISISISLPLYLSISLSL